MPKLEPKLIQRELEQGQIWPFYWLYGHERMKSRELLKRIRQAVLGAETAGGAGAGLFGLAEEIKDGLQSTGPEIVEAALSPSLGGGVRLIVVQDAHAVKESEALAELLGEKAPLDRLTSVVVCLSKDLDGRKKFSKLLLEKAAVVPCEEVPEAERAAWIGYLAKRRGITLAPELTAQLAILDPWTLDIVDQELEKYSLLLANPDSGVRPEEVLLGGVATHGGAEGFIHLFLTRQLAPAIEAVDRFADQPDESLPLLGLLSWNVRQLALIAADRENRTRTVKLNPYLAEKLEGWSRHWSLTEILAVQTALAELDFGFKQRPLLPLGLWTELVTRFCK